MNIQRPTSAQAIKSISAGRRRVSGNSTAPTVFQPGAKTDFTVGDTSGLGVGSYDRRNNYVQTGFGGVGGASGNFANNNNTLQNGGSGGVGQQSPSGSTGGPGNAQKASTAPLSTPIGATPSGKSANDALTKALLDKVLADRKTGEEAVKRAADGKVSSIDQSKLDESTKKEIAKLGEQIQKDSENFTKMIKEFKETLDPDNDKVDKDLDGILDKLSTEYNSERMDHTSDKFNPQAFLDAADSLASWKEENADHPTAQKEGFDELFNSVQEKSTMARQQVALAENNPDALLKASAELGTKIGETSEALVRNEDGSLKEGIPQSFADAVDANTKATNPEGNDVFDSAKVGETLGQLSQEFDKLPKELQDDPDFDKAFQENKRL